MKMCLAAAAFAVFVASCLPATAQQPGPAYAVTYLEALPARKGDVRTELLRYADKARHEDGAVQVVVLERTDKPHQFAVLEGWRDVAARDHDLVGEQHLQETLRPMLTAPFDRRPHGPLVIGEAKPGAIMILTHVDIVPDKKDVGIAALKRLAAATRDDPGLRRFDVLQQTSRPNHFTLVESWADRAALEDHRAAAQTRAFRAELMPMSGSLYDERVYRALD